MRALFLALCLLAPACVPTPATPTPAAQLPPRPVAPVPESVVKSVPTAQPGNVGTPASPGGYPLPGPVGTVTPQPLPTPPSYAIPGK